MSPKNILIVDDDSDVRESLALALAKDGTSVRVAENATRSTPLKLIVPVE